MDKVFHVFVSSTYLDLVDERKKVSEAVAKAGYVAEGMEIFPASSQKQMDFIKRVIDRCDYYILIVAGRYGSRDDDGVSYTEKEFRYALSKGIPILTFLRNDCDTLPANMVDTDPEHIGALLSFKEHLQSSSVVDYWSGSDELATKSLAALSQARVSHEGTGWIRANRAAGEELLEEVNNLRKQNSEMEKKLLEFEAKPNMDGINLAGLDDDFTFEFLAKHTHHANSKKPLLCRGE